MKYAFSLLITFIAALNIHAAQARTIFSFHDSEALTTVAQFLYDVAEDIPVSTRLSDKKINIKDFSKCDDVSAEEIQQEVETSIKRVLRFYPDEEIPFEQAISDLEDYLDHQNYKKCTFENKSAQSRTMSTYYADRSDRIHLRLDNVALSLE